MYLQHFNLKRAPFEMKPDDEFLYMSTQHSRALLFMDYAAWNPEGFVIISGEIGAGKTTLLKRLLKNYSGKVNTFHVAYTNLENNELFLYLAKQAKLKVGDGNKVTLLYAISEYLKKVTKSGTPFVMVIDEAQNLTKQNLEDIRLLSGLEGPNGPMMKVVMLGQPELQENINQISQLRQRVKLYCHLNGLSEEETCSYIDYRLKVAGMPSNQLFDRELMRVVYQYTGGIPRLINKVCDALLMCAFGDERSKPIISDVEDVLNNLMLDGEPVSSKSAPQKPDEPKAADSSENTLEGLDGSSVSRIVSALESIDNSLKELVKKIN